MAKADLLAPYKAKRDFSRTTEPSDGGAPAQAAPVFVVQKHWASRLHYDFRLELGGTLKSWAVPKGPSFDPADKRMAVHVEDHPLAYARFEGEIPPGQYGAGKVIIWDKGYWLPVGDASRGYREGKLKFELHGHKLKGRWTLVRMSGRHEKQDPWLLIKEKDDFVRSSLAYSVVDDLPDSLADLEAPSPLPSPVRRRARSGRVARPSALPATLQPQLATLVDAPPPDSEAWLYEIKFDGYRLLARVGRHRVRLLTRNGHDWTARLPHLVDAFRRRGLPPGWYDGEIVLLNEQDLPDFQALQGAFDAARTERIVYYLFDLPYSQGRDMRSLPLCERRAVLAGLLQGSASDDTLRFSVTFDVGARDIVASACRLGLEGVIGKRRDSPYTSARTGDWIKLRCSLRQEFVIGGFTAPQGAREGFGSLLLGVYDEAGRLVYAGNVGTGFNHQALADIRARLDRLRTDRSPFSQPTGIDSKSRWVWPVCVAEVSFVQWTQSGRIRHAVFQGLREDKPAHTVVREDSMSNTTAVSRAGQHRPMAPHLGRLRVTSPERVIDPSTGLRKIDLMRYYAVVGALMMPHLKGRPVSLVRAPDGIDGQVFFQKHMDKPALSGMRLLSPALDPGHEPLVEVATARGLLHGAQMNVVEYHTWNATKTRIDRPDRMTFDLDPGKGVSWLAMQEATMLLKAFLDELALPAFVKTSGGKGLHVVVPLKRHHDWDVVRGFSRAIVQHLAQTFPGRFSAKSGPRNRVGKIFIDYLRNGFGATTVAAWSARARPGMGVSVPVAWDEVDTLRSATQWHVRNIHERLDRGNEPWRDYEGAARTLTRAMKTLGFEPPR